MTRKLNRRLKATVALAAVLAQIAASGGPAAAFCGFYVAKADFQVVQQVVQGRARAGGPDHRDYHGERL